MFSLENKSVIVTGGANGIGASIVKEFLKENPKHVAILDVDENSGKELEKILATKYSVDKVKFYKCDVTNDEQLIGIFYEVAEKFGAVDVVVNNAGIAVEKMDTYKREIAINYYVAFIDVDDVSGKELEKEIKQKYGNERAKFFQCDVTKTRELYDVFDQVAKENGYIDVVVNNAGIAVESPDMFVKEIEINFTAVVSSSLKALEIMRVDQGGKGGTIINVSSITALSKNITHLHIYAATKKAILYFSTRLGETHYPHTNVRVITTCLGLTDTQIVPNCIGFDELSNENVKQIQTFFIKKNELQSPEDVSKGVMECYKNGKSGSSWVINNKEVHDITHKLDEAEDILAPYVAL